MAAAAGAPPSFQLGDRSSVPQVLRLSLSSLLSPSALPAFLSAALLLLSFRSTLLAATLSLSSAADRDPHLRPLLSRLSHPQPPPAPRPRYPSRDDHPDSFFSPSPLFISSLNASSSPLLFLGPTPRTPPRTRPIYKTAFKNGPDASPVFFLLDGDGHQDRDRAAAMEGEPRALGRGLDLDRREAAAVLYLLGLLSSAHSLAILGFVSAHSVALGLVFLAVASRHLGRRGPFSDTLHAGARLGMLRLTGFVFLRWAARDALAQFLCIVFLSDIADQGRLFKLFIIVKFMPFSLTTFSPMGARSGMRDTELTEFLFVWVVLDTMLSVAFAFVPWVMVMDRDARRRGRDVIREGLFLVTLVPVQAFQIKCLETVVCGNMGRWVFTAMGGWMFAMVVQSVAEVYFMVAWLMLYFGARCKEGELEGRRFGLQDLEDGINGIG